MSMTQPASLDRSGDSGPAPSRTVVLASTDAALRARLKASLNSLRWQVREASGGAEAIAQLEEMKAEALMLDSWLPDLDVTEFVGQVRQLHPAMDLVRMDGAAEGLTESPAEGALVRSPRRNELLHALREAQQTGPGNDTAVWATAALAIPRGAPAREPQPRLVPERTGPDRQTSDRQTSDRQTSDRRGPDRQSADRLKPQLAGRPATAAINELIGASADMATLRELIRLVAPRNTSVLVEGETGTGKEVVARALHRLSNRSGRAFVVLNCAAIPESLLEAELFGHTRGAFTGAVQSRTGRIEAAHGGTLFLDEIGEMPLALQAKMLRFLECGELQRVGDNETLRVDVRVIAATHQPLEQRAQERTFRLDLYHRLAVFPIEVPALRERRGDIELLVEHFLDAMGQDAPRKRIRSEALAKMRGYDWPGNVRELMHVLERAVILAEERAEIEAGDVRFGRVTAG